jgi:putative ABC transport system permease protein
MSRSSVILLTPLDLSLAALLVLGVAALTWRMRLGLSAQIVIAALRTTVQLLVIGLVLRTLFDHASLGFVALLGFLMLLAAGREVRARPQRPFAGGWGWGLGTMALFLSSFTVTILGLAVIIGPEPWYEPQYAIPLLGMLLGNTMTGVAVALDRLTGSAWTQRNVIEQRLALGEDRWSALHDVRQDSIRAGLIPIINAMAAAGIVSLPGMMTGQILAGSPPVVAVQYQILIMFLIAAGTGFGTIAAVLLGARRLFDDRHRLRLERLTAPR